MNELIMLVDLPASGKSTWAKEYSETHPDYIVHSSDKLCVGAYECLTCFDFSGALTGKDIYDAFYTANLIYYHMHPYLSWSQSNKAKNKDKYLIGKQMFSDVMLLHEADVKGH